LQSAFTLIYTFMIVEVTGCDLGPVVHAISFAARSSFPAPPKN